MILCIEKTENINLEDFFENELARKFEEMIANKEKLYYDSEQLEELIIYYLEIGDISYAELVVNYGLELHPNSIEIKTKKLEVLLELEHYPEAKRLIEELQATGMENTDFLVCCAKYYSSLGNPMRSIEYCKRALALEEEENFLHNFLADEYVNLGDPFNALKHYKKALKCDPSDDYALENIMVCYSDLNKGDEAIKFLNGYLDDFAFSETAWMEYGQFFFNRKNYHEAIKGFDYLLAINPLSVGVYSNKAACYEALGEYEKAIDVYIDLLSIEYTKAYTFYKIGLCYKELKSPIQALASFQKSLIEDPQFYLAMMEQSYLYEDMGSMKEALHFAKEAARLNVGNLDYQKRLAFLYVDVGDFEQSLLVLQRLVEEEPNWFFNWYVFVEVLMLVGEYEQSVSTVKKALRIHPRAELFYQLSNSYHHLKMEDLSMQALEKAQILDPSLLENMQEKYPFIREVAFIKKEKKK